MKKYFLILLIFCTACVSAQVPGYMGRKLVISYSPAFGPVLLDPGNAKGDDVPVIGATFRNDLDFEYCIGRGLTIVPTVKYATHKMRYVTYQNFTDSLRSGFVGDVKLGSMAFGIKLKNYSFVSRGGIAPLGNYFSFELLYESSHIVSSEFKDYYGVSNDYDVHIDFDTLNYKPAGQVLITLGGGKQQIYKDKWLLDVGWEIGMSLSYLPSYYDNKIYTIDYEPDFNDFAHEHIAKTYMLNFSLGFGYLLPQLFSKQDPAIPAITN